MVQKILFSILLSGLIIPMSAKIKTVYTLPDSVLINETSTDEHGEFAFTNLQSVNKMLKFSVDGYKEISFRALPEQNVKLRGEAKEPEELAVK